MPYWSRGKLGIREGDYTGTQKFHLGSGRSMAYNVLTANTIVPRLCPLCCWCLDDAIDTVEC